MLTKEQLRIGKQKVAALRKNPPKITEADRRGADAMLKDQQKWEKQKDKDIASERQAVSKDLAGFVHNQISGVGQMFNGIGPGKSRSITCQFPDCGKHEGEMFNMNDGKWYCRSHKGFGNLTVEQKEKELCHA